MGRGHGQNSGAAAHAATRSGSVTPGAKRLPMVSAQQLGARWREQPESVLVISDVHSDLPGLQRFLGALGAVDADGVRSHTGQLIQVGDLMDGRDPLDLDTLRYGAEVFDRLICGNHEAAYLGGKTFSGQRFQPEVERELGQLTRDGKLDAAFSAHGVLVVHGGAHPAHFPQTDPSEVAQTLNEQFVEFFYRRPERPPAQFFEHTAHGGRGGSGINGGAFWCDWRQLVGADAHSAEYRQVVGHSPLHGAEASADDQVVCIDLGGRRLGAALILPAGEVVVGSDGR
jgi:hypothetical protein